MMIMLVMASKPSFGGMKLQRNHRRCGDKLTLDTLLVFFVWRQDHEKALEGDGEAFEGRRKPARL